MQTITLANGAQALVDDADYAGLSQFTWRQHTDGYARATVAPGKRLHMEHVIMGVERGVDHIDRNPLNNQRANLRLASSSTQGFNRDMLSRDLPRGVSLHRGRYQASIRVNGKLEYLGRFDTPDEASTAYEKRLMEVTV